MRSHRVDVPREFVESKKRELYSSMFGFNTKDGTALVSYKAKKNKIVILMSTMHQTQLVSQNEKKKPEIVEFYNRTKGGVDVADQMVEQYSTKFATRRWPVVVFSNIIDMAALNAYKLERSLFPQTVNPKRRIFLKILGNALIKPFMNNKSLTNINPVLGKARRLAERNRTDEHLRKRARCHVCPRESDKKTSQQCNHCQRTCCTLHLKTFCSSCLELD